MLEELDSFWGKHASKQEISPQGTKTIKIPFDSKMKCSVDGGIERYKSRLVARAYTRHSGVNLFGISGPVARL